MDPEKVSSMAVYLQLHQQQHLHVQLHPTTSSAVPQQPVIRHFHDPHYWQGLSAQPQLINALAHLHISSCNAWPALHCMACTACTALHGLHCILLLLPANVIYSMSCLVYDNPTHICMSDTAFHMEIAHLACRLHGLLSNPVLHAV